LKFLGQAKKFWSVLATEPETKAEYFNVRCVSGHRVRGERTEGYQALRCPACGEGVFVLPRSPLPLPTAPKRSETSRSRQMRDERLVDEGPVELSDPASVSVDLGGEERGGADADIIWDDALPEAAPPVAPKKVVRSLDESVDLGVAGPPAAAGAAPKAKSTPRGGASPGQRARERTRPHAVGQQEARTAPGNDRLSRPRPEVDRDERVHEIKPLSRKRLLNRVLIVLVPVLVLATVAWRYRQNVRQGLPLVAEKGRTEGITALEAGEFDKANQLLSAAKSAVDDLGGAVQDADNIRQAADEAAIFVNLISEDLGELLGELGRMRPSERESRFDTLYKGRSIVLDTIVTAVPDGTASSKYELAFRILPPGESSNREGSPDRMGVFDLTGFQLFEQPPRKVGDQVIFGAQLQSLEYDADLKLWLIRFMPKSGVYITHTKALESMHWGAETIPVREEPAEEGP
jgi:DNA-directed RNA polymerase subunit RPC12/RpoP